MCADGARRRRRAESSARTAASPSGRDETRAGRRERPARRRAGWRAPRAARKRRPWRRRRPPPRCRTNAGRRPCRREPAPHAARAHRLPFGLVRMEGLADLEQREIAAPLVGIALRRLQAAPASRVGRMSESSAAIGLASASSGAPPPKCFGLPLAHEGPGHGFDHAARRERPARQRDAFLRQASARASAPSRCRRRGKGGRGHASSPPNAHDLLDEIGLAFDVGAPGGRVTLREPIFRAEARSRAGSRWLQRRDAVDVEAGQALRLAQGEVDPRPASGIVPGEQRPRGSPPQISSTSCVARSSPGRQNAGSTPRSKR